MKISSRWTDSSECSTNASSRCDFDWLLYGRNQDMLVQKQQEKPLKVSRCSYSSVRSVWTWAARLVRAAAAQNNSGYYGERERPIGLQRDENTSAALMDRVSARLYIVSILWRLSRSRWPDCTHLYRGPAVCVCERWSGTRCPRMSRLLLLHELMWSETHGMIRITDTRCRLRFGISERRPFMHGLQTANF